MRRVVEIALSVVVSLAFAAAMLFAAGCDDAKAYRALHPLNVRTVSRPVVCRHYGDLTHAGTYRLHCRPEPVEVCEVPK